MTWATIWSAWLVVCWPAGSLTQQSCPLMSWNAKSRLTKPTAPAWLMVSRKSPLLVRSLLVGLPLSLATHCKVSESSDSTKFLRTFTRELLDKKMLTNTKRSAGLLHLDLLKSLQTPSFVLGKPWSLKSNFPGQDSNILTPLAVPSLNSKPKKEPQDSTKDSSHSGLVKSPTPSSSSLPSNGSSNFSMIMSSLLEKRTTPSQLNWELLSLQAILPVSSAPSCPTPLIPSWANFTVKAKVKDQLDLRLQQFINKSASRDCGLVWWQESSWLVPSLVSNGGSTIHSKLQLDCKQLEEEARRLDC